MKTFSLALTFLAAILFAGCNTNDASSDFDLVDPAVPVLTFTLPTTIPTEKMLEVAQKSFTNRGWDSVQVEGNSVSATLLHRGIDASVRVQFDGGQVAIYSDSWNVDQNGKRKSRAVPMRWIANLQKDIRVFLGLPIA